MYIYYINICTLNFGFTFNMLLNHFSFEHIIRYLPIFFSRKTRMQDMYTVHPHYRLNINKRSGIKGKLILFSSNLRKLTDIQIQVLAKFTACNSTIFRKYFHNLTS